MKKIFITILILLVTGSLVYLIFSNRNKDHEYQEVALLTDRLGTEYKKLHEVVATNERLGINEDSVQSKLYQNNEGWLLRTQTVYCSNRLVDHIENISLETGINKYIAERNFVSLEDFKEHIGNLDELCVSEALVEGEKVLETTLFISPEHKIWRRNS